MRYSILWLVLLAFLGIVEFGCSSSGTNPNNPTGSNDSLLSDVTISAYRLKPLRIGENYFLWFKYAHDSAWRKISVLSVKSVNTDDSVIVLIHPKLSRQVDSLQEILISLEQTSTPEQPGLTLWQETVSIVAAKTASAVLDPSPLGNFSPLSSSLVFTSASSDSTRYKKEFYLTTFDAGKYNSSLSALPVPPTGWKYGLWSVDSNFTPIQSSFYGLFTSAAGNDSYTYNDTLKDNLPYPGGAALAPMDRPSGSIIVTLEPDWYGNDVRKHGPSPFSLLHFDRFQFIQPNVNYPMTNVSKYGIPSGRITIRQAS